MFLYDESEWSLHEGGTNDLKLHPKFIQSWLFLISYVFYLIV